MIHEERDSPRLPSQHLVSVDGVVELGRQDGCAGAAGLGLGAWYFT